MKATISITPDGKKIVAVVPYAGGQGTKMAKQVSGARAWWDKSGEKDKFLGWTYPLTMDTCWAMRRVFGADLEIEQPLAIWAREELGRRGALEVFRGQDAAASADALSRVSELAPALFLAMSSRPYQLAGAAFLVASGGALLGDEPGLGKTLQTIAALVQHGSQNILVACPRTATRTVWLREVNRWAPHIMAFVAQGNRAEREQVMQNYLDMPYAGPKMLVINTEMIRTKRVQECRTGQAPYRQVPFGGCDMDHEHKTLPIHEWDFLFNRQWDAIVLDEAHNSLASTKNIQSKSITQVRYGAMCLRRQLRKGGLAVALSGTPFRSKLERAWGTLNWLRPDVFSSFWRFAETHFEVTTDGWGHVIGTKNENGKTMAVPLDQEAFDLSMRPYYLARDKQTAAPDLPPITYAGTPPEGFPEGQNCVWVDMDPKQAKAYATMVKLAEADVSGGKVMATGILAEMTRLRQFANAYGQLEADRVMLPDMPSSKVEWILEFLRERDASGGQVVIASSFTEMVHLIAGAIQQDKDISSRVLTLTGATTDKERLLLTERFQDPDDDCRIVVINRKAGGEAITLDRADDMIVVDQPWLSDEDEQLEARIHRVSRIHNVTVYRLASVGTIDEGMARLTDEQRAILRDAKPAQLAEMMRGN
jgi:SNF2 family DNA or RNA helicase